MCLEDQPQQNNQGLLKMTVSYVLPCCSVTKLCPPICHPMDCSMPGFPVLHCLPELAQTHVHWVSDAIQPSHSLSPPSLFAFNFSQHQGLFQWVSFSHQVAQVLELQLQHPSFQWISTWIWLYHCFWRRILLHLFFQFYSDIISRQHAVKFKVFSNDLTYIYHEMIITIILMNVISYRYKIKEI